jgi:predicted enzyme related to lactoylglutathione lyase
MSVRFEIFPSDIDATADFYTQVLKFAVRDDRRDERPPYLALERDGVRIGAAGHPEAGQPEQRQPPTGVELVLEVDDLGAEYDRVRASGWPIAEDLQQRPWGLTDFRVLDPSGYYLRITSRKP